MDQFIAKKGTIKTFNKLEPAQNKIDIQQIGKFLGEFDSTYMKRTRVKGPDYLITDDITKTFEIEKEDLISMR